MTTIGNSVQLDHALLDRDGLSVSVRTSTRGGTSRDARELRDLELAVLEHVQRIVRQVDVALVDLVDQDDPRLSRRHDAVPMAPSVMKRPMSSRAGSSASVLGAAAVAGWPRGAGQGVVVVQTLRQRGAGIHVPGQDVAEPELVRHGVSERRFARCRDRPSRARGGADTAPR